MYWCIYRITNKINGKTYIGQHIVESVLKEDGYMGSGSLIRAAMKKYGRANFEKTYITIAISQSEANVLEEFYIAEERAKGKAEYNIADGAYYMTDEAKKKLSKLKKRVPRNETTKQKIREYRTGKHWYTNGKKDIVSVECPKGFWRGRTYHKFHSKF